MRLVSAVAVVALVSGCAASAVSGTPTASPNELFDPCAIPADSVRAAGANPTIVSSDYFGVETDDWDLCTWSAGWYYLTVLSTTHTFDEVKTNPQSMDFRAVTVSDRDAVSYIDISDPTGELCDVAFPWAKGVAVVSVAVKGGLDREKDPCAVALLSAQLLDPVLPR